MTRKKLALFGALAIGAAVLTGCAPGSQAEAREVPLPDGRTVICVFNGSERSGMDCDWANAKVKP